MSVQDRVERLLADRDQVPWTSPSQALRARTVSAIKEAEAGTGAWKLRVAMGAAACVAAGATLLVLRTPVPTPPREARMKLDPAPMIGSVLVRMTSSAEASLESEAKELLEDTNRLTRRVIAQLPFTGGG